MGTKAGGLAGRAGPSAARRAPASRANVHFQKLNVPVGIPRRRQNAAWLSPPGRGAPPSPRQYSRRGCDGDETGTTRRVAIAMGHLRGCDHGDYLATRRTRREGGGRRTLTEALIPRVS